MGEKQINRIVVRISTSSSQTSSVAAKQSATICFCNDTRSRPSTWSNLNHQLSVFSISDDLYQPSGNPSVPNCESS